jgi:spore maturation protein SpmA
MESLQELNPDKDRASDAQIMFMCLHAGTLIATSIMGIVRLVLLIPPM